MSSVQRFVGNIPELYDRHLGPVLFEPYAIDVAGRVPERAKRILELAAGTGRLTRHLLARLPEHGELVVTDLNEPMIEIARTKVPEDPRVTWKQADMQALPFKEEDGLFDVVVCQFGLMFVPDKLQALREMRRVLKPGGTLLLSVWDQLGNNPASKRLHEMASALMPDNPPAFMATPFSMSDPQALKSLALEARFAEAKVDTVPKTGVAESAADLAVGFVRGNPLWNQLVERGLAPDAFQGQVAMALASEFGDSPCKSPMAAHVLTATT
jgi:ubiquinone/menaquinone biosynthesis C-methylase UbiE